MESALIVPVPAAGRVVGRWRRRFDPAAAAGVPAHITVIYPFVHPASLDDDLTLRLRILAGRARAFPFRLERTDWFEPGVLWLAPDPSRPFRALTEMVMERWPDLAPYGGAHDDIVPHLTVGMAETRDQLVWVAREPEGSLPLSYQADERLLIVRSAEAPWRSAARLPLDKEVRL